MRRSAFTLIELLVVVGIIATLATVVTVTLNPIELLRQSRDSQRLSDIATLQSTLNLYLTDQSGASGFSLGSTSTTEISVPDPNASTTCGSLGLAGWNASSGITWQCTSSSSYRQVNGSGWVPVHFSSMTGGAPISALPVDPSNQTSTGLYYAYSTNGAQFAVTADLESVKYKTLFGDDPQTTDFPEVILGGTPSVSTLYNPSGLVGYWNFDEGSGSIAYDSSGNNDNGTWFGTSTYTTGRVGFFAGGPFQRNVGVQATPSSSITGTYSVSLWAKETDGTDLIFTDNSPGNYGLEIELNSTTAVLVGNGTSYLTSPYVGGFVPNYSIGTWYFVTVVVTPTTATAYINGSLLATQTLTTGTPILTDATHNIMIGSAGGGGYSDGYDDDVRVYTRALSPAEVMALYNAER